MGSACAFNGKVKESGVGERPDHVVVGEGGWREEEVATRRLRFLTCTSLAFAVAPFSDWRRERVETRTWQERPFSPSGSHSAACSLSLISPVRVFRSWQIFLMQINRLLGMASSSPVLEGVFGEANSSPKTPYPVI
jgi:hypothetical protein